MTGLQQPAFEAGDYRKRSDIPQIAAPKYPVCFINDAFVLGALFSFIPLKEAKNFDAKPFFTKEVSFKKKADIYQQKTLNFCSTA